MHLHIYKHYLLSRNPLHCRFVMSDSFSVASGYWAQAYFMAFWCPGGGELLPTEHHWCSVDVEGSGVNDGLPLVNHDWSWLIIVTDTWQFWLMVMVPILHGYGLLPIIMWCGLPTHWLAERNFDKIDVTSCADSRLFFAALALWPPPHRAAAKSHRVVIRCKVGVPRNRTIMKLLNIVTVMGNDGMMNEYNDHVFLAMYAQRQTRAGDYGGSL